MRKFNTYRALDRVESVTPIIAYPILSKEGSQDASRRYTEVQYQLMSVIGMNMDMTKETQQLPDEFIKQVLEAEMGDKLIDISDLI